MIRFLADENFDNRILRGLLARDPAIDIVRVQDTEIAEADDPRVLEWAAEEERILLTHDVRTMTAFTIERVKAGLRMPGIVEVSGSMSIGDAIEDLLLFFECSLDGEWEGQILYVPL